MNARVIGLTGQTGAGKSTVGGVLSSEGFRVINCDALTREVQGIGSPCVAALAAAFGRDVVREDGSLDRRTVAARAFADEASLKKLNCTVYPYIMAELQERIKALSYGNTKGIVLDAPTLFESGADTLCSEVIAVVAPEEMRRTRIMVRDGITEAQARARMAAQQDDAFYTKRAQYVICNVADQKALEDKAHVVAKALLAKASAPAQGE